MEEVLLILFSVLGFSISYYIWKKIIRQKKKLVCMIGDGDCDDVVNSKYGRIFGINNTIVGMAYYSLVFVTSIAFLIYPFLNNFSYLLLGKILVSGGAALTGIYLASTQLFILKKWCEYCLASSALSLAIFLVVLL